MNTAYETKVILKMLANYTAQAKSIEDIYKFIQNAANAEGLELPPYEVLKREYSGKKEEEDR